MINYLIKMWNVTYDIERNSSEVTSCENIKAPGSAFESNSSASVRSSLKGFQLK